MTHRSPRQLTLGLAGLVTGVVAALSLTAGVASAHATLESADPANGSMLTAPPDHVELVFSENVGQPAALEVLDAGGNELEGGEVQVVNDTMTRAYDPTVFEPGTYTVSYQVTSADGHPIAGTLSFMVHGSGEVITPSPSPTPSSGDSTDAEPAVVVALALLLVLGLGAALVVVKRMVALPDGSPTG